MQLSASFYYYNSRQTLTRRKLTTIVFNCWGKKRVTDRLASLAVFGLFALSPHCGIWYQAKLLPSFTRRKTFSNQEKIKKKNTE